MSRYLIAILLLSLTTPFTLTNAGNTSIDRARITQAAKCTCGVSLHLLAMPQLRYGFNSIRPRPLHLH